MWRCGTNYGGYTKSYRFGQLTSFTDKIRFTNHGRQFQTRAGLELGRSIRSTTLGTHAMSRRDVDEAACE